MQMKFSSSFSFITIILMMLMFFSLSLSISLMFFKKKSFECGLNNITMKKNSFSTNFIMMTMMFLIFDVEVSFLIPIMMMNKNNYIFNLLVILNFLVILTMILMKEWNQGSLEWNK